MQGRITGNVYLSAYLCRLPYLLGRLVDAGKWSLELTSLPRYADLWLVLCDSRSWAAAVVSPGRKGPLLVSNSWLLEREENIMIT